MNMPGRPAIQAIQRTGALKAPGCSIRPSEMLPKLTSMTSILTNLQLHEAASNKGLSSPTLDLQKSSLSPKAVTCMVSQDFEALNT